MILGGRSSLEIGNSVHEYLLELCKELVERVDTDTDMHSRVPKQVICSFTVVNVEPNNKSPQPWREGISLSKTGQYPQTKVAGLSIEQALSQSSLKLITKSVNENEHRFPKNWGITLLSLQATNFITVASEEQKNIFTKFLNSPQKKELNANDETSSSSSSSSSSASSSSSSAATMVKESISTSTINLTIPSLKENHKENNEISNNNNDIDMDVFNALPADIQQEILNERNKNKRQKLNDNSINKIVVNSSSSLSNSKQLTISDKIQLKEKEKQKQNGIRGFFK